MEQELVISFMIPPITMPCGMVLKIPEPFMAMIKSCRPRKLRVRGCRCGEEHVVELGVIEEAILQIGIPAGARLVVPQLQLPEQGGLGR